MVALNTQPPCVEQNGSKSVPPPAKLILNGALDIIANIGVPNYISNLFLMTVQILSRL